MLSTYAALLSAAALLSGCRADTFRIGEAVFVRDTLAVGEGESSAAAGFLDGDSLVDLAVANDGGHVIHFRGSPGRLPDRVAAIPAGEHPTDLVLEDVDARGGVDIVVANHETDYLTILLNDGRGGFRPAPNSPLRIDVRPHPHAVKAVALASDEHVDLVVDDRDGRGLLILRGRGDGTFELPGTRVDVGGDPYRGMAIGDVNGDGRPDLLTPNETHVAVRLGTDRARLQFAPAPSILATYPFAVELADLDADGALDVVAASGEESSDVQVFLGDGRGAFREMEGSPFRAGPGGKKIARGDFDGDGTHDVAVTSYGGSEVLVLLGGRGPLRTARLPGGTNPWGVLAADLNGDRKDDLLILDAASSHATVYLSTDR